MKRSTATLPAVLAVAATLTLTACGSNKAGSDSGSATGSTSGSGSSSSASLQGSITVFAAASLTEAFDTIKQKFEAAHPGTSVTTSYGASSALATQIGQGKAADVFASASVKNMKQVTSQVGTQTNFVSNTLEIAVPPSNPGKITKLADLTKSGLKIAVCEASVPCGTVARQVFAKAKLTVKPAASLSDVKTTLATVESGQADAGLVYVTDVRAAKNKVKGIAIPAAVNASTQYPIATVNASKNKALADAFVQYVLSVPGQRILAADGFSKP